MERVFDKRSKIILLIIAVLCIICITPSVYAAKKVAVTKISLNKTKLKLEQGKSETLTVTVFPGNATNQKVTWSGGTGNISVKNGKVTVSNNAKVGETATIVATSKADTSIQAKCKVTVIATPKPVKSITLSKNGTVRAKVGKEIDVQVTAVKPKDATNKNITWKSSNTKVATVTGNENTAKVVTKAAGTATITATAKDGGGAKASFTVKVVQQVESLKINKSSLSLKEGKNETLKATINPSNAESKTIIWTSSNRSVATVTGNGNKAKIVAMKEGKTTITASVSKTLHDNTQVTATCTVIVLPGKEVKHVTGISMEKSATLTTGKTVTLTPTITPKDATNKELIWASNNTEVATVNNGKVKGVSAGKAVITVKTRDLGATGKGYAAKCTVTVKDPKVKADKVTLTGTKDRIRVGSTLTGVTATLTNNGKTDNVSQKVTWTSNKPNIATVNSKGEVTGVAAGKAKITATAQDGGRAKASFTVTVVQQVTGIEITNPVSQMVVGDTHKLEVKILPEGVETESKDVKYTSSDPEVLKVTKSGKLTALKASSTPVTITAEIQITEGTSKTKTDKIKVKVIAEKKATNLELNPTVMTLKVGGTSTLKATVTPSDTTDTITYVSKNNAIAKVSETGLVTGLKEGTAKIIVKVGKLKQTCSVIVKETCAWPIGANSNGKPLATYISSNYGNRKINGQYSFHGGIDIACDRGTPVIATRSGKVIAVQSGYGEGKLKESYKNKANYVIIEHTDETTSRYWHLSTVSVKKGQYVTRGQQIGKSGNSGYTSGPHLHFELRDKKGNTLNPNDYVNSNTPY